MSVLFNEDAKTPLIEGVNLIGQSVATIAEQNRKILLGLFGKQIEFFVKDIGVLIRPLIIDNIRPEDLTNIPLKYKSIFLPDKNTEIKFQLDTKNEIELSSFMQNQLADLQKDGLIKWENDSLSVTTLGWSFLRNICAVFDKRMNDHRQHNKQEAPKFSQAV